jgi:hypothetical protein
MAGFRRLKRVCDEERFFITLDLDFADIRRYSRVLIQESLCSGHAAEVAPQSGRFLNES